MSSKSNTYRVDTYCEPATGIGVALYQTGWWAGDRIDARFVQHGDAMLQVAGPFGSKREAVQAARELV